MKLKTIINNMSQDCKCKKEIKQLFFLGDINIVIHKDCTHIVCSELKWLYLVKVVVSTNSFLLEQKKILL